MKEASTMALSIKASLLFKPVAQLSMSVPWGIQPPGDLWGRPKCLKSFIDAFITQFLLLDRRVAFSKPHWPRPPLLGNAGCAAGSQHCLPALASCLPIVVASSRTKPLFDLGGSPSQTPVQGADTPYERMKIRSSRVDIAVVFSSYPLADLGNPR